MEGLKKQNEKLDSDIKSFANTIKSELEGGRFFCEISSQIFGQLSLWFYYDSFDESSKWARDRSQKAACEERSTDVRSG